MQIHHADWASNVRASVMNGGKEIVIVSADGEIASTMDRVDGLRLLSRIAGKKILVNIHFCLTFLS